VVNRQKCVLKILKPVKLDKIFREIKILQTLFGAPNIVKLLDVLREPVNKTPCFVYEYMPTKETKKLFHDLDDFHMRLFMYKLMEALDYAHSQGIIHRDVKPLNIVINLKTKQLRLIDWGLADFYKPETEYNVRVASRYYKGPELLVEDKLYHYSLDVWSAGCTMANMIFRIDTFFKGSDNVDQLVQIVKVLGTDELHQYINRYGIKLPHEISMLLRGERFQK
jgi:casein kinase II subunit alpha